jgi:DNA-binding MarR family transcriptional regulator/GNAT superfamily N-acetyltransferase
MKPPSRLAEDIGVFREFNRMYTRFIGTLEEGLLHTKFSLAEARVIYELATREVPSAKDVAEALGLDAGYLSRILAKLEQAGLLKRKASGRDSRASEITLTRKGRTAFANLNTRSDEQARTLLKSLLPADRGQLIHSMRTMQKILVKPERDRPAFVLRPHRVGDMGWVVSREAAAYAEQYGWDQTFEGLVARVASEFVSNFDPGRERCWMAEADGQSVGHIFLTRHPDRPDTAKLRLLFVEPAARGMGLGNALVNECIQFARSTGYRKIVLWTQSILLPAIRIYRKAGFRLVEEQPHHSFGKNLIGQTWELDLS